jgi:hypothetical protein
MSKIQIEASEHKLCDVSESWINHHVHARQEDRQSVCVKVTLKSDGVDMVLSTPQCSHGRGGGRRPNEKEEAIFKLWDKEHLNEPNWTADNLIVFVKKVHQLIC